jgi:hypothetical protein
MWMILAAAFAVVAGSIALAQAEARWFWALLAGLVVGEAYAIVTTMDRVVTQRAALQAPAKAAAALRIQAEARLLAAVEAQHKADAAAVARSAEKDCKSICSRFLETSKAEARAEVDAARKAVEALPAPVTVSPLAETLGWSPTTLELVLAVLGSLAANGFGGVLIAFGAHGNGNRPSANDRAQVDIHSEIDPATIAVLTSDNPENDPPKPRGTRKTTRQSNVVAFPAKHPVMQALDKAGGSVSSNKELARLMGVTDGEASKRVREVADLLSIERNGKETRISLKSIRAA